MSFQDKDLTCVECNQSFTFTADDQQFHSEKGYTEPKRCPSCRASRRAGSGGGGGGGYSSYGDSSYGGGGGGYRAQREMHPATCAQCNKETQVPFLPRGDKPVYCSDCFSKRPQSSRSW
ncbi:MAG TPA: CxxC-x17-CxxC domain-containing protein [Dehalococcoidia bacterium]|nr:CxxC-x17-CxxC domain-containing protein [Dehalococcoidia bacterium]